MPYVTEQNLTDVVLERWKAVPDPRLRQVMQSLIPPAPTTELNFATAHQCTFWDRLTNRTVLARR